jgi:hypothetical protein
VVAALEGDDAAAARRLPREAERALDGLAAGVREEEAVQAHGEGLEALDELEHAVGVAHAHLEVARRRRLPLDGVDDRRVAVARARDADARREVQIVAAFAAGHAAAPALDEDELRRALDAREELGLTRL